MLPVLSRSLLALLGQRRPEGYSPLEIEATVRPGRRKALSVWVHPEAQGLPTGQLYHLLLAGHAVALLGPEGYTLPLKGSLLTPDGILEFPWGEALLEVDTGHYPKEAVEAKLRAFGKADRLYWASTERERLEAVGKLAHRMFLEGFTPLLLPEPR